MENEASSTAKMPYGARYPVLLLGGALDERREPSDTPHLAEQFRLSAALVKAYLLQAGHGLEETGLDHRLSRTWLAGRPSLQYGDWGEGTDHGCEDCALEYLPEEYE